MRVVMMGTGTFAEPTFRALLAGPHEVVGLVTQPDRPAGARLSPMVVHVDRVAPLRTLLRGS